MGLLTAGELINISGDVGKGLSKCEAGMFQSSLTARDNVVHEAHNGW